MLSSFGFDARLPVKNLRNNSSKYFDMPRGFSVHVFKNPSPSTHPYGAGGKTETAQPPNGGSWQKPSPYASRSNFERKPSLTPSAPYRTTQAPVYPIPYETKRSKSTKNYGIYPDAANDVYIYETSFSTASDGLASSSSSSSSEADYIPESAVSTSVEISSTRASSSTETLETTALAVQHAVTLTRPVLPRTTSSSDSTRLTTDGSRIYPPGLLTDYPNSQPAPGINDNGQLTRTATVDTDSDSDTFIDNEVGMPPPTRPWAVRPRTDSLTNPRIPTSRTPSLPRYPDDRGNVQQPPSRPRASSEDYRIASLPPTAAPPAQYRQDIVPDRRTTTPGPAPAAKTMSGRDRSSTFPPSTSSSAYLPDSRRNGVVSARDVGTGRQGEAAPTSSVGSRNESRPNSTAPPSSAQPMTRQSSSRPDIAVPPSTSTSVFLQENLTVATKRCVRWTEDLMCPCPVPRSERRRGWFNRRGDQLWTNDGKYRSPEPGMEYPPDLMGYPEPNCGWMNEEGVRIDMDHRLIPKPPIRSALKRPKPTHASQ